MSSTIVPGNVLDGINISTGQIRTQLTNAQTDVNALYAGPYVIAASNAAFTGARLATGTANQISITDGGAGSSLTLAIASNPTIPGTGSMVIPTGTTAQRTPSAASGALRWNTDTVTNGTVEIFNNGASAWYNLAPLTTKGDVYVFGTNTARLPVGTDGQVVTADSTQTLGVKWATPTTGGVTTVAAFSNTSTTNGLNISTTNINMTAADGTNPGGVSTTTQTFAGNKTFNGNIITNNTVITGVGGATPTGMTCQGGDATGTNVAGSNASFRAGNATGNATGGSNAITAGTSSSGTGGNTTVSGGTSTSGTAGNVTIAGGTTSSGTPGTVNIQVNATTLVNFLNAYTQFINQAGVATAALTDGSTISWNVQTQQNATVTLGGNRTLAFPSNPVAGYFYVLAVQQDATGSRTLSYASGYDFGNYGTPVLSVVAGVYDILTFRYDGTNMALYSFSTGY